MSSESSGTPGKSAMSESAAGKSAQGGSVTRKSAADGFVAAESGELSDFEREELIKQRLAKQNAAQNG